MPESIKKCICGAEGRLRHKGEFTWVECKRKNCDKHSGFIRNVNQQNNQEEADKFAIELWNRMVDKDGKNR